MRRHLVALPLAIVLGLAARATADDWKWNPQARRPDPKVGDKAFGEGDESHKMSVKATVGGQVVQNMKEEGTTTYRFTREVVAAVGTAATEGFVKIESWKLVKKGEDPDTSLEGKTVRVKGVGDSRTYAIEDDKDKTVSDEARGWIESEIAKKPKKDEGDSEPDDEDEVLKLFPTEPVPDGAEWKLDMAKVVKAMGMKDVDTDASTGKGSLSGVKLEKGVHTGHVEVKLVLVIKQPGLTWKEGGTMEMTVTIDGSLERDKQAASTMGLGVKMGGKGELETDDGKVDVNQKVEQKRTTKSGPLEK